MVERGKPELSPNDVIEKIVAGMRGKCVEFPEYYLAPRSFHVYLHKSDYERLESLCNRMREDAARLLDAEIEAWNEELRRKKKRSNVGGVIGRLLKNLVVSEDDGAAQSKPCKRAEGGWQILFYRDSNDEVKQGRVDVIVKLDEAPRPDVAEFSPTLPFSVFSQLETPKHAGAPISDQKRVVAAPIQSAPMTTAGRIYAAITYVDSRGKHVFEMKRSPVVIGRGGTGSWVDISLDDHPDVSREHLRLRWDEGAGRFFLKDLSSLGSTVNGKEVPSSIEIVGGDRRDKNVEIEMPPRARIVLAGVVDVEFEARFADGSK